MRGRRGASPVGCRQSHLVRAGRASQFRRAAPAHPHAARQVRRPELPRATRSTSISPSIELLDGGGGFGHYVSWHGMERAIELARINGLGIVGVKNSNFFGAGAYTHSRLLRLAWSAWPSATRFQRSPARWRCAGARDQSARVWRAAPQRTKPTPRHGDIVVGGLHSACSYRIRGSAPARIGCGARASRSPTRSAWQPARCCRSAAQRVMGWRYSSSCSAGHHWRRRLHGIASMYNNFTETVTTATS